MQLGLGTRRYHSLRGREPRPSSRGHHHTPGNYPREAAGRGCSGRRLEHLPATKTPGGAQDNGILDGSGRQTKNDRINGPPRQQHHIQGGGRRGGEHLDRRYRDKRRIRSNANSVPTEPRLLSHAIRRRDEHVRTVHDTSSRGKRERHCFMGRGTKPNPMVQVLRDTDLLRIHHLPGHHNADGRNLRQRRRK